MFSIVLSIIIATITLLAVVFWLRFSFVNHIYVGVFYDILLPIVLIFFFFIFPLRYAYYNLSIRLDDKTVLYSAYTVKIKANEGYIIRRENGKEIKTWMGRRGYEGWSLVGVGRNSDIIFFEDHINDAAIHYCIDGIDISQKTKALFLNDIRDFKIATQINSLSTAISCKVEVKDESHRYYNAISSEKLIWYNPSDSIHKEGDSIIVIYDSHNPAFYNIYTNHPNSTIFKKFNIKNGRSLDM